MAIINLRDHYPFYKTDLFIEVPNEVLAAIVEAESQERNYIRRAVYNNAHYSLDRNDGIEHDALFRALSPCEIYERRLTMEQLYSAIAALPDKQGRRIYAHYILGVSQTEIAKAEGVNIRNIRKSIANGLRSLEVILKNLR